MKQAGCERARRGHAPWVRALAGLATLPLLAAPVAGVTGLVLEELRADRELCQLFYAWFWLTVLVVFFASLAGITLWAVVRLGAIALGVAPAPAPEAPADWPLTALVDRCDA